MHHQILLSTCIVLLAACGEQTNGPPAGPEGGPPAASPGGTSHHGAVVALGHVELGGRRFAVARHGPCRSGEEGAFVVSRLGEGDAPSLFLWVADAEGEQISAPARGDRSADAWHFHVTPREDAGEPARVVVRLREGDLDERVGMPLHHGAQPAHGGVAAPLRDAAGTITGWVELKLHDDKGDLELWLAQDPAMEKPLDLPLDSVIEAGFAALDNRTVELRVRNTTSNEDEAGNPNVRDGRSNYFIFPGQTGADASWLQGAAFRSPVTITVPKDDKELTAGPFILVPHAHGPGGHKH